ncbi:MULTISPECIES: UDP-N-acetylglucosamine--N-acetylmuramyl-(pentapeptide) pyrophosphoryl-undecaprenol N-acetylglucosamine transferase [unclassified Pseudoclavibacter]|uniref:UDP-N-acetylglucosamine--N-acetylmuramyl- (pentapeptide) pyrophosphoryl-undecaprenol N-acetylglucosamine transferase n=1 Tax=unclassified Pseudoclavibacter TaxID=2615177 RepID=UPI0013016A7D|nr:MULTISPECIES: UDP-N-acetylglucosamine--N-acetylmuramyl-(pentapeptide) pyrophosphoryl-undecaprenol N-acetylglucosamine transferase [unclassified Pseudoclavibacter]KAB1658195.1 UDP-N-acetylglucosamine--N-acetylmuramyl-(pentapeptide) pyrophosphoryl-undecaprenol N-acetylglucosamine transferase [Pseudoclavibacter sp. CFCC 11306]KAB1661895.1 UDP-N-acetylglucosamine--N-acetylmuramyl-(pentapeptide) pyrophosphoryl-undecaprenol N-acetylglucosamine transferase [Pseudoclavibacter sp. CFCC 13796]
MTTYLLAGGGTAGHVNPLLATADALRESDPNARILVLGTAEGLEAELVPARGYELIPIAKLPFPRRPNAQALAFPKRLGSLVRQVRSIIVSRGVDAVVGFGGYASAPAYLAARREGVAYLVHEANARPGLANRLGAKRAAHVAVAFPDTPLAGAEVIGMPLRPEIAEIAHARAAGSDAQLVAAGRTSLGLDERPVLLVTGGSLGAKHINEVLASAAQQIVDAGWQVLHVAGARNDVAAPDVDGYHFMEYCHHMQDALAVASLAVSRSGASTVCELTALAIPAVYVPYPHGNGEQELNARPAIAAGAAMLARDEELDATWVTQVLLPLLADRDRLDAMHDAAVGIGIVDAAQRLADMAREVAEQKH